MPTTFNILEIRRRLGRDVWGVPREFGADGWLLDHLTLPMRVLISDYPSGLSGDGRDWIHASMSHQDRLPTYEEMVVLHRAVWPDGWAYEVHAPADKHINLHPNVLHLWGLVDGSPALPNFGKFGSI